MSNSKADAEDETRRVAVGRSVQIREGEGLVVRQNFRLDPSTIRPTTAADRKCSSWFRRALKKSQKKSSSSCLRLNDHRDQCIQQLVQLNSNETNQSAVRPSLLTIGSKLFCENHGQDKFIGHLRQSKLCFQENHQLIIEHLFNDVANLADAKKNKEILQFISEERKLKAEFEDDCQDETTLEELNEPKVESRVRKTKKKTASEAET